MGINGRPCLAHQYGTREKKDDRDHPRAAASHIKIIYKLKVAIFQASTKIFRDFDVNKRGGAEKQMAGSREQRAESRGQRAESRGRERGAGSREQGAIDPSDAGG